MVFRTYVEKRQGLAPECEALLTDCRDFLGVQGLRAARIWNRYDVEGIEAPLFENACRSVFSEPPLDLVSDAADTQDACAVFAVEPLPGQFDQRADSASQCIQLLSQGERPRIRTAKVYALYGMLTDADVEAVKRYVINPVESREASLAKPETLAEELAEPKRVASVEGFTAMDEAALSALLSSMGLAMDIADLKALQDYFRETERRDPTVTELRVVDTYWSDHCRHTTFSTHLDEIRIDDDAVKGAYARYLAAREEVYGAEKAAQRRAERDGDSGLGDFAQILLYAQRRSGGQFVHLRRIGAHNRYAAAVIKDNGHQIVVQAVGAHHVEDRVVHGLHRHDARLCLGHRENDGPQVCVGPEEQRRRNQHGQKKPQREPLSAPFAGEFRFNHAASPR